jgi:hypothetical protein
LDAPSGSFHVGHNTRKDNGGWVVKVLWVMEPGTVQPVTITGQELDTGSTITFNPLNGSPSQTLTLDPDHPGTSSRRKGWTEYPSTLAFPEAGCYVVEATWADGSWQRVFGFGR